MNCEKFRKLIDKSNEMATNNLWGEKSYVINEKIWEMDNNNFTACTRLAKYYKLNDNMTDAKRMYLKALEIYPNNYGVKNKLNEIERLHEETKFIDELITSRECYNSGQNLSQKGHHWLARECYSKAYSIEPLLEYGVALAKSYSELGEHYKIKRLYKELMDSNASLDIIEDIKVDFVELLKDKKFEQKIENKA